MPAENATAMLRHRQGALLICLSLVIFAAAGPQVPADETIAVLETTSDISEPAAIPSTDLLLGEVEKQWQHFSSKQNVSLNDVWKVEPSENGPVLVCVGNPKGFLFTRKSYSNFEFSFEWRYVKDPAGNSGILVFTQNEPRLWPTSMQVQLHQPRAGAVFPSGDAVSDNSTETVEGLALDVGKWNTCSIVAREGRVSVKINDRIAGEVSGCKPSIGRIAIQSEGSQTQFRRMQIRDLTVDAESEPIAPPTPQPAATGGESTAPDAEPDPS